MAHTGLYGKLPALGDFLSRRLPEPFVAAWDAWLAAVVAGVRTQGAERWAALYDSLPVRAFALDAGVSGPFGALVVSAPGRDRVDRRFPLSVAVILDARTDPLSFALGADAWIEGAVRLLDEYASPAADPRAPLDARLDALDALLAAPRPPSADLASLASLWKGSGGWTVALPAATPLAAHFGLVGVGELRRSVQGVAVSWPLAGGGTMLASRGLAEPGAFAGLWAERGVREMPARAPAAVATPAPIATEDSLGALFATPDAPPAAAAVPATRTASAVEPVVEATTVAAPGLLYLACAGWPATSGAAGAADRVRDGVLGGSTLRQGLEAAIGQGTAAASASAWVPDEDGGRYAWFGNGAIFRLRGTELERLVASEAAGGDSLADLLGAPSGESTAHDGAVVVPADVQDGDRILLCADGGYGKLSWSQLMSALQEARAARAAGRLRDIWQGPEARVPGAIVLAFDLTDAGLEATHAVVSSSTPSSAALP